MEGISVVIPTKDRLHFLRRAVPMFLAQEEVKEVVVVIDGCKDGTLEYLEESSATDARIRFINNVTNRGLPASRNVGIDAARCDYVFTGEDDLEICSDFFRILLAHMLDTGADIISGRNIFRFEQETAADAIRRTDSLKGDPID